MGKFDFKAIEERWKDKWYSENLYRAEDFSDKPKKYILAEFPYPSGRSMHVGHMMRYTVPEIYSRFLRMRGYNVMFPMGWDAFGLPTENFAIKTGVHPSVKTAELAVLYRKSMQDMGYGIDWEREINTTDPAYYKWTQWIFLRFFEAGLAELRETPVWWSEKMKTVLAEEEVEKDKDGNLVAERDGSPVVRKMVRQWVLKIPEYADKLIDGLEETDFPEFVKSAQINWIGRSEGARVEFKLENGEKLEVFTTRPDTLWGATFMVLAPEHEIAKRIAKGELELSDDVVASVKDYLAEASTKSDLERLEQVKDKTGVFSGLYAVNPVNGKNIPIWISDFVLASYGTGAIMAVPAHDERDYDFAKKFDLPIIPVIQPEDGWDFEKGPYTDVNNGLIVNSEPINGLTPEKAFEKIAAWLEEKGIGKKAVSYKIRDWIFSRQRYWGEPIPLIHKEDGTIEAIVHTEDVDGVNEFLPLELPDVPDFSPSGDGSSPLARNEEWVKTTAKDGTPAERETNTMPNWAGSSWYYLRYIDPKNDKSFADYEKMKYWLPVDHYFGGSEHTTLHLLYSRFWHKFLYDEGKVPTPEPYAKRTNGGILLAEDGTKMSKSKNNFIEPQEKMAKYGADALRTYIAFMGPYEGTFPYSENSLGACYRLVSNIYDLRNKVKGEFENDSLKKALHKMIKNATEMAENLKMNTFVSEIMVFVKVLKDADAIPVNIWKDFIKVVAPLASFTAEELWQEVNGFEKWTKENSIHVQSWPEYDESLAIDETVKIGIQINGKVRGDVSVNVNEDESSVKEKVLAEANIKKHLEGKDVVKFIYIPGKIVNIVSK